MQSMRQSVSEDYLSFLINPDIPLELKDLVLDYFSFSELANFAYEIAKGTEDKVIQDLIISKFRQRRKVDLQRLTDEIAKSIKLKTVDNIIASNEHHFQLKERAIIHLCLLDPDKARILFYNYLYKTYDRFKINPDPAIIAVFLKYCHQMEMGKQQKEIGQINRFNSAIFFMKTWFPLVEIVLANDSSMTKLVLTHYAKYLSAIMSSLNELQSLLAIKFDKSCYSYKQIIDARISLLLGLEQSHNKYYTLTYADKRLVEKYIFDKIKQIQDKPSLLNFYSQIVNKLYLNQKRHSIYDAMTNQMFPTVKKNVLTVLVEKLNKLNENLGDNLSDNLLLSNEKENLDQAIFNLKQILTDKNDQLFKQKSAFSFGLFYSTSRTNAKQSAIEAFLKQLENVSDFTELRILTESILLNKELIRRRSVGVFASDTHQKVRCFYEDFLPCVPARKA
jgi:hypothetical protein